MTFPNFAVGETLRSADMNAVGWWKITPTGATNGTISSDGDVVVNSAVGSVTVSGAFSADYDNYRIIYTGGTASTQTGLDLTLGSANSQYFSNLFYSLYTGGGIQILNYSGATKFTYAGAMDSNQNAFVSLDLYQPFASASTRIFSQWMQTDSSGFGAGVQKQNTSYTAFTLTTQTGTISGGSIRIYGYRN